MPNYALEQNAAGAYCQIKTLDGTSNAVITINSGDTFDIEFVHKATNSNHGRPFGNSSSGVASRGLLFYTAWTARISNSTATNADFTLTPYTRADYNKFNFVRDGSNNVRCYVNDVQNDTEKALTGSLVIDNILANGAASTTSNTGIEYLKVTINGTLAYHFYDTTGTGLILAEHVNGTVRSDLIGFVDDDTQWSEIAAAGTTVNATLASVSVTPYQASIISTAPTIVNATLGTINIGAYTATVISGSPTIVTATVAGINVVPFPATVVLPASITTEVLKNNTGTVLASTGSIVANVYDLTTGALVVHKTGLTSDASGVVTFSDAALVASTEYLVTITIATADGVARIMAG